jgi:rod shape-determining protein MreC
LARRSGRSRRIGRLQATSGAIAAVLIALGLGAMLTIGAARNSAQSVQSADDDAIAAGGRFGGGALEFFADAKTRLGAVFRASDEIRALQKENAELREWKELALALSESQQRYEQLLGIPREELGQAQNNDKAISARLILDPGGPFKRTLLANAGSDHGVKVGYVAINENGLIGRVISVGKRSARVLLLDDYTSRVPVMGESSRARAMLIGQAGQKPRLETGPLRLTDPRLDYVVGQGGFRRGERLVTSGDGGIYPRGLSIGVAAPVGAGWGAELGAARAPIDYIRLIPPFSPDEPPDDPAAAEDLPPAPQALYMGAPMTPVATSPTLTPLPPAARPKPRPPVAANAAGQSGDDDGEAAPGPPQ